jgi:NADPH:quinone reductase-like Zn-dependent oxidoreductase
LDSVGGDTLTESAGLLAHGGRIASLVEPRVKSLPGGGFVFVRPKPGQLATLAHRVSEGEVRVRVEERFGLADAAEAHAVQERGGVRGKLVLAMPP